MMTPILTTLGFVMHPDGERVLMVHRIARPGDEQLGKYNGLGGKVEPGEDVVAGMKRELREEARIEVDAMRLRGTVSWPGFGRHGEDHFGFIFLVDSWHPIADAIPDANEEGPLTWERVDLLDELPMWEGDRYFLPLVFDPDVPQFHGCLPYHDGRPTGWSYSV
ncbi:8-oxo-dGTP diphosphatase [Cutibacterium acnes]|uniref:NUDIX hydrolase n=1 Tax=Cutibacterium acnes TaxID=1747 RepID=UPI000C1F08FE|nr:8-oxo-dGTP diphosphatase [Cutibacterium acnes]MDF2230124.1 8-oxo-dGTP diphosphatase [Cutibacterium acnes subsp. defendens]PIS94391.1 7,8-dihydro-8-oxoguanine triphosphatase [Cutibacterium acnes]WHE30927.1 8-oxo-dGTP diphosphatase [Cutibacterium acnes subsp. acnes]